MLFSDYIEKVARVVHMDFTSLIVVAIFLILCGAVLRKVFAAIGNLALMIAALLVLLFAFHTWDGNDLVISLLGLTCVAIVGKEAYGRLSR